MSEKMMKAAVLTGPQQIEIKELPVPEVREGEIEIKVSACGVCGSDIHMWKAGKGWGKDMKDFVMGHEFCGVVTNPNGSNFKAGERVVFWANLYCGECDMCRAGLEHLCRDVNGTNYIGFVCNGAYAEKFVGKAKNAYRLPDSVSDVAAGLIDPLMVAYHAVRKANIKLGDKVLVVGTGIIGNMIGELAKKSGASYVAMSKRNDRKLARAKEAGYFDDYFDEKEPDVRQKMVDRTHGGFDVAFEVVGAQSTLDTCIHTVKPGGSVVMIGNSMTETIPVNINRAVLQEVRLIGSVSCTREEFTGTIDLIADGIIDPERYVTDILPLTDLQQAFERLTSKTDPILKAVVKP
ncbi:MAG: alcohol dehydrogenase catalytic domain-containing protein [Selenomonadaceae bacterium]|nr:alcohol dehydrogenase catalytic domain-containing protein [Selenomonadaceae bacterium]